MVTVINKWLINKMHENFLIHEQSDCTVRLAKMSSYQILKNKFKIYIFITRKTYDKGSPSQALTKQFSLESQFTKRGAF